MRFSSTLHTAGVQVSDDGLRATHVGNDRTPQMVFTAGPVTSFSVRVVRNPTHNSLFVGFAPPVGSTTDSVIAKLGDFGALKKRGFRLCMLASAVFEPGQTGPEGKQDVPEGAIVTLEKDLATRSIRLI